MVRRRSIVVLALCSAASALPPSDPAADLVGVGLTLTTTAAALDLTIEHATLANAVFALSDGPALRASYTGNTVRIIGSGGGPAEVRIDLVVAGVREGTRVGWILDTAGNGRTTLAVENRNGPPVTVDEFETSNASARFSTDTDLLRARGPLPAPQPVSRKVLAFYYPWYDLAIWSNPQFLDLPARLYSTDDAGDARRTARLAQGAGIDALAISWQGKTFEGGWNHRRMLLLLDAARQAGLEVCALLETTVANPQHDQVNAQPDPDTVYAWLSDIVDSYGAHPAYLRENGRPVVFAYAAQRLRASEWAEVRGRLRSSGRDLLLIGEGSNNTRLAALDGLFFYGSNVFQGDTVREFHRGQSLSARTYHLLPNAGSRRLWVATVSPGYDDTRLADGRIARVTPREEGRYYDRQWQSALDMRADWVVVTSWNEWWENTHIEPSRSFGAAYLERTLEWTSRFKRQSPSLPTPNSQLPNSQLPSSELFQLPPPLVREHVGSTWELSVGDWGLNVRPDD